MGKEYGPAHTTQQERFGGFALAHLSLSVLSLALWMLILSVELPWGVNMTFSIITLLIYFPLGMFAAWMEGWTVPFTAGERWQAVLYPTAVAWAWVGVVISALLSGNGPFFLLVFPTSMLFAAPSSVFILVTLPLWDRGELWGGLALVGLLAGVLPPLLFAWGSFCQARWAEKWALKKRRSALSGA